MNVHRRHIAALITALFSLSGVALFGPRAQIAADTLPRQLSDRAFWRMIEDFSEPGGFFRSDNFLSNESTYQEVIPALRMNATREGVYLGVGPDQNFTYITALNPRMSFVIDIRRQNMLEHLMYKAIIEASADRADFLSRLFSRPRPPGLNRASPPGTLFDAYATVAASEALFQLNLQAVFDCLIKEHGFPLSPEDRRSIEYVYRAFYSGGPDIRYSFPRQLGGRWFPSYADLMMETDLTGVNHGYMASEENFSALRDIERNNLLIPIVGDFGGSKAIRAVGRYLREHGASVNFFYTSNVEQYLFQTDAWQRFYANVGTLPVNEHGTFIRSYFNMGFRNAPAAFNNDLRSLTLLDPIAELVTDYHAGQIRTYADVIDRSR